MPKTPSDDYVLIMRPSKKGINPAHLREYQERMGRIAPICARETSHLRGSKRVMAFNYCIAQKMREEDEKRRNNNSN